MAGGNAKLPTQNENSNGENGSGSNRFPWYYVAGGAALAVIAAVVAIVLGKKKKK